jgi:agmatinase
MSHYLPADSMKSPRFTGVPTFARLPLVRTLEDVDLVVVGVPFDTGVVFKVGGRFGPNAIRAGSVLLRGYNNNVKVKPWETLSCVDYGDVAIVPGFIQKSFDMIEAEIAPIFAAGVIPLLLGGDHGITLPHLRAAKALGMGPVAVVDFDSHIDALDMFFGEKYNNATWMRRAIEEGLVDVEHSIEIGMRGSIYDPEDWTMLRTEFGLDYRTTEEVFEEGPKKIAEIIRKRVGDRPTFMTFDIDFIDPAFAPGTGSPEQGGPSTHDALQILRGLTGINFVGFDICEVIPVYDNGDQTATVASNIGFEMVSLAALRHQERGGRLKG